MFSGISDPARYVLVEALEEAASVHPDRLWITETEGETMTFGSAAADMHRVTGHFAKSGVGPGDFVAVMMHNSCEFIRVWLGLNRLGAVAVLLNTELRGDFLAHQIRSSNVRTMIVDARLLHEVTAVLADVPQHIDVVVTGSHADVRQSDSWQSWRTAEPWSGPLPQASDIAAVMYTSGTTGPSKGVLMPHAHCTLYGIGTLKCVELQPDDVYYITLPLFHANGLLLQLGATILMGIPAVIRPRFSASAWLKDIRDHRVTVTNLLGTMAAFVLAQPQQATDADHTLRACLNAPNLPTHEAAFRSRFGVRDVISGFGMTECNIAIWGRLGASAPGAAGWVHEDHFEVIIVNPETDTRVPHGVFGEILVRPKVPFGFMAGYHELPDKTVEAWRNLWFHSGDGGTMDSDGLITFVDRIKDCIRRRGENISATEVELAVSKISGIGEVAAYAVASDIPGGEDEVMLAVVLASDMTGRLTEVVAQVDALLPKFARPRYIKLLDELPKTGTGKVQRAVLKKAGTEGALDRDDTANKPIQASTQRNES